MADEGTVLKALLRQRHLQEYEGFKREFRRAAQRIDGELEKEFPSKATFHRWLSGKIDGLPYPGRCRVLEELLPGWSSAELFEPWDPSAGLAPRTQTNHADGADGEDTTRAAAGLAGLTQVYMSRSEFSHSAPPHTFLDGAVDVKASGLSLNMLCQNYPDKSLAAILERGCEVQCLFLDPDGSAIQAREEEEGLTAGHLSSLTRLNMQVLERVHQRLSDEAKPRLKVRKVDEPIRFNITLVDDARCFVQMYLPEARGIDSPTFAIDSQGDDQGLYSVFEHVFISLWNRGESAWSN